MIQINGQFGCHLGPFPSDRVFIGTSPSHSGVCSRPVFAEDLEGSVDMIHSRV